MAALIHSSSPAISSDRVPVAHRGTTEQRAACDPDMWDYNRPPYAIRRATTVAAGPIEA